ncbi:hypothetical protein KAH94_06680 [bacterium]|nr:hypothetical protein [bacterium]
MAEYRLPAKTGRVQHVYACNTRAYLIRDGAYSVINYTIDMDMRSDERMYIQNKDDGFVRVTFGGVSLWCPAAFVRKD